MQGPSQQVSFRLAAEYADELEERAQQEGVSRGEYVRQLVIASLTAADAAEDTRNRVAEVQDELQKLREELWTSVTALLVHAGKVDQEKAQSWVKTALMK